MSGGKKKKKGLKAINVIDGVEQRHSKESKKEQEWASLANCYRLIDLAMKLMS